MKRILSNIIIIALSSIVFSACKKSFNDEVYHPNIPPQTQPDLTAKINMTVSGFITDENGNGVFHAAVQAGTRTVNTDEYGYFSIKDVMLPKTAGFIKVTNGGYFIGYRSFVGMENKETFVKLQLVPKVNTGTINSGSGGTVTTADGGSVTLPGDAVVVASNNTAYSGTINVAAHLFSGSNLNVRDITMPGNLMGINTTGYLKLLKSNGMMAVELTGDGGQLLQIAEGKQATINVPISSTSIGVAPESISLWSFDTEKGLWKEESTAAKTGNSYTGNVSHFSFWDVATGVDMVNVTVQVVNGAMQPMANVHARMRKANEPATYWNCAFGITNAQGFVSGPVFANESLIADVPNYCSSTPAYSIPFTTGSTDVDLGSIRGDFGQFSVTFSGTATNCSGGPVTDGYVILMNDYSRRIEIVNGTYTISAPLCTNIPSHYVAIDNSTHQQSSTQTITLVPGNNNAGNISACGISTMGFINYTIDGIAHTLTEPEDTLIAITSQGYTTIMNIAVGIAQLPGSPPYINFQTDGGNQMSGIHVTGDIWSDAFPLPSNRGTGWHTTPYAPLNVTFTEYGNTGEFIAGYFGGTVKGWDDSLDHTINCSFRVRRFHSN